MSRELIDDVETLKFDDTCHCCVELVKYLMRQQDAMRQIVPSWKDAAFVRMKDTLHNIVAGIETIDQAQKHAQSALNDIKKWNCHGLDSKR